VGFVDMWWALTNTVRFEVSTDLSIPGKKNRHLILFRMFMRNH